MSSMHLAVAQPHDRALAELLFDLRQRGLQGLGLFGVRAALTGASMGSLLGLRRIIGSSWMFVQCWSRDTSSTSLSTAVPATLPCRQTLRRPRLRPALEPARHEETSPMRILIAEDDQVLADGLLRSLRSRGLRGRPGRQRQRGRRRARRARVRPADPRPRPAEAARPRGAARAARARLDGAGADPDRGRQRRAARQGPRPRRRRLHGQAVLAAGTRGAGARAHAARPGHGLERHQARPADASTRPAAWPTSTTR